MYRATQQQINDVLTFGMSILIMGFVCSMVKSLGDSMLESGKKSTSLLPQATPPYRYGTRVALRSFATRNEAEYWVSDYMERLEPKFIDKRVSRIWYSDPYQRWMAGIYIKEVSEQLPQVLIEGGEPVPPEYRHLLGWLREPLPEYSLLTELLPAVEVVGERKIDTVLKQLKEGVEGIQDSYQFRLFLTTMSKFHDYSIGNLILIAIQKPDATRVAGFNTWKDLERWVKKGERGIAILAPVMPPRLTCSNCGAKIVKGARFCPRCGEPVEEEIEVTPRYFKVVYVFDISQTEGKPLPEFEVPVLTGEVKEELFASLLALMKKRNISVSFESRPYLDPAIKGQYSPPEQIWVRPEEPRAQQLKTLLHEVAHYYSEGVFRIPRRDAETIAESAAFVVGAHNGFDTGVRSFPYVALWAQDKKVLEQNLGAIRRVATTILEDLEKVGAPVFVSATVRR